MSRFQSHRPQLRTSITMGAWTYYCRVDIQDARKEVGFFLFAVCFQFVSVSLSTEENKKRNNNHLKNSGVMIEMGSTWFHVHIGLLDHFGSVTLRFRSVFFHHRTNQIFTKKNSNRHL